MFLILCAAISLDAVWAHGIPDTQSLHKLEPDLRDATREEFLKKSVLNQIRKSLAKPPKERTPGFAVAAKTPREAMLAARDALRGKKQETFTPDDELWLVFYTYEYGAHVRLDKIEGEFTIHYHFHHTGRLDNDSHIALIPVGKLKAGKYPVQLKQGESTADDWAKPKPVPEEIVCSEFIVQVAPNKE